MQIQILDSWLREHLQTKATVKQIAEILSLTSVSVEKTSEVGSDHLYDIEVTTNRPDLMSVTGLAREAAVALNSEGIIAKFLDKKPKNPKPDSIYRVDHTSNLNFPIEIINDPKLVNRICAVVVSVKLGNSPQIIRDRLEATDIRSINNVVDVTNYVMRELGHPMHAFDSDKIGTKKMIIREAKKGEKITTLDKKDYVLNGDEIVADNGEGKIIDLLGIMGLDNSAVSDATRNVLLFVDNNDNHKIRKASMELGIRSDAAVLNEKGIDPELSLTALLRGIELLQEIAGGKPESGILDIYPKKPVPKAISVSYDKINQVIGVSIPEKKVVEILEGLDFKITKAKNGITVTPPTARIQDIEIPEDVIEEIARMYGYHKLPSILPPVAQTPPLNLSLSPFFWENKAKNALKYWGFTEVYTYSLVSEDMLEIPAKDAVTIANPLGSDMAYMRTTLIPSLLDVVRENKSFETIKIFELANVYYKKTNDLPQEVSFLSGILKKEQISFFEVKGIIEGLFIDLGINKYEFKKTENAGAGADIVVRGKKLGEIQILDRSIIDFEINFTDLLAYVSMKKTYVPAGKFPAAVEDLRVIIDPGIEYEKIVSTIKKAGSLVSQVELLDTYQNKKTFRITYQSREKNLTGADITELREKVISNLKHDLHAEIS